MELDRAARRIRELIDAGSFPAIVSVYLFGSVAEGREHRESDIDIGVILDRNALPSPSARFEQRLALTSALSAVSGPAADVVILNDAPPTFSRAIVTKGTRILCRDAEADHAFVRDVMLQAPDLEMYLQRMRAIKLNALARR